MVSSLGLLESIFHLCSSLSLADSIWILKRASFALRRRHRHRRISVSLPQWCDSTLSSHNDHLLTLFTPSIYLIATLLPMATPPAHVAGQYTTSLLQDTAKEPKDLVAVESDKTNLVAMLLDFPFRRSTYYCRSNCSR